MEQYERVDELVRSENYIEKFKDYMREAAQHLPDRYDTDVRNVTDTEYAVALYVEGDSKDVVAEPRLYLAESMEREGTDEGVVFHLGGSYGRGRPFGGRTFADWVPATNVQEVEQQWKDFQSTHSPRNVAEGIVNALKELEAKKTSRRQPYQRNASSRHTPHRRVTSSKNLLDGLRDSIDALDQMLSPLFDRMERDLRLEVTFDDRLPNTTNVLGFARYPEPHRGHPEGTVVISCQGEWSEEAPSVTTRPHVGKLADSPITMSIWVEPMESSDSYRVEVRGGCINKNTAFKEGGWTQLSFEEEGLSLRDAAREIESIGQDISRDIKAFLDAIEETYDKRSRRQSSRMRRQSQRSQRRRQPSRRRERRVARGKRAAFEGKWVSVDDSWDNFDERKVQEAVREVDEFIQQEVTSHGQLDVDAIEEKIRRDALKPFYNTAIDKWQEYEEAGAIPKQDAEWALEEYEILSDQFYQSAYRSLREEYETARDRADSDEGPYGREPGMVREHEKTLDKIHDELRNHFVEFQEFAV